jgi:predicted transcriptional regulator
MEMPETGAAIWRSPGFEPCSKGLPGSIDQKDQAGKKHSSTSVVESVFTTARTALCPISAMTLSRLQLSILRVLWSRGEATVSEVQRALEEERPVAYTTVSTMLSRLEQKGAVSHRSEGRAFFYRAAVRENEVSSSMVSELVERVFEGSPAELVSHLLETQDVDAAELARIKAMVAKHEAAKPKRRRGGSHGN